MTKQKTRPPVSWELLGLFAIFLLVGVGVVAYYQTPKGQGELVPPDPESSIAWAEWPTGVTDDGLPYVGRSDAEATVYEFSDFQCPFCADFVHNMLAEVLFDYVAPGDVRLVWVAVGFDGPESVDAGKAAICASDQDRFWEMHDWLYANQSAIPNSGAFTRERLLAMAAAAGADPEALAACLDDPLTEARFADNETLARSKSVATTPNFLVGDRLIEGANLDALKAVLDDVLQR